MEKIREQYGSLLAATEDRQMGVAEGGLPRRGWLDEGQVVE